MTILFVDDLRDLRRPQGASENVLTARTSTEAFTILHQEQPLSALWLDHDLGGEDTTRPLAQWLEERGFHGNPYPVNTIYLHTANGVGRRWLQAALERYYHVVVADPQQHTTASTTFPLA